MKILGWVIHPKLLAASAIGIIAGLVQFSLQAGHSLTLPGWAQPFAPLALGLIAGVAKNGPDSALLHDALGAMGKLAMSTGAVTPPVPDVHVHLHDVTIPLAAPAPDAAAPAAPADATAPLPAQPPGV